MAYLAFYRSFRPATFDDVVRQEHIVRILTNQIATGKIGHAYLFCGPRGTGKTTLAKIFARAINCESPVNHSPCGKCAACRALAEGSNLDISEIDAASNNGVDEMRDLREKVQYPPVACKYKVYIIDEVHMLTPSAFNAVLKTLEEPPAHAVFILATTEPQKIPATILSRCMRFDFKLIPQKDLEGLIRSVYDRTGKEYEDAAISAIARAGAGSARDSLSIADMCASYSTGKLTYDDVNAVLGSADWAQVAGLCGHILNENASDALAAVENILATGKSVGVLVKDMLSLLNNVTIVKVCKNAREIVNLPEETYTRLESLAAGCDGHKLLRVTEVLTKAESDMRFAVNARITLETAVFKCATPAADYDVDALLGRVAMLEKKLEEGVKVQIAPSPAPSEESVHSAVSAPSPQSAPSVPRATSESSAEPVTEPSRGPVSQPGGRPTERRPRFVQLKREKPVLQEDDDESPFKAPAQAEVQPSLWESGTASAPPAPANMGDDEKKAVFGRFVRALRTTRKNAVLFTLCMDLGNFFEGDKLVLTTESEAVYKALTRTENAKFIADVLLEQGVAEHEVRFLAKGESEYDRALKELKSNFEGADIDMK